MVRISGENGLQILIDLWLFIFSGKYIDTDSDSDTLKPIRKPGDESDEAYDSDRDPVWTPVSLEKKNSFEASEVAKKKRIRKPKR